MKVWKLVSGILSIILFVFVSFQSCAAGVSNALEANGEASGSAGIIVAILMLAGGIVSIAALVAAPVALVAGGIYHITNQNNLGRELESLFKKSLNFEEELVMDNRDNVKGLLIAAEAYRKKLSDKHHDLRRIKAR